MNRLDDARHRDAMTLPKACEWIGSKTGKTPATSTIWRWTLRGVRGGIRLESFRIGGTTYTTPRMMAEFIDRTSFDAARGLPQPSAPAPVDADARRREIASAQDRLRQLCAPKRSSGQSAKASSRNE
jgi:hypothetical protein